jgi:hypothetical protein
MGKAAGLLRREPTKKAYEVEEGMLLTPWEAGSLLPGSDRFLPQLMHPFLQWFISATG